MLRGVEELVQKADADESDIAAPVLSGADEFALSEETEKEAWVETAVAMLRGNEELVHNGDSEEPDIAAPVLSGTEVSALSEEATEEVDGGNVHT